MQKVIRIATRKSPLALWQANFIKSELLKHHPELIIELIPMTTQGDQVVDRSLSKIGGKGLFVKELENALLNNEADIAVHSMKDVPMHLPEGLIMSAMTARGSVEDVFVSEKFHKIEDLPSGARVGTSSARRKTILQREYPHLESVDVRGNVQTRLKKCETGEVDALILAAAGLERLDLSDKITQRLPLDLWLPAPGQGAIGIESRVDDYQLNQYLKAINDQDTWTALTAERMLSRVLNGGCSVPLAAYAALENEVLFLRAWWVSPDNQHFAYAEARKHHSHAEALGEEVANVIKQSMHSRHAS
ncbi:MAG: hydroxymethylbilane synthase [Pseudomonadota bacterium]